MIVVTLKGINMKILIMNRIRFIRALEDVNPLLARNGKRCAQGRWETKIRLKKCRSNAFG